MCGSPEIQGRRIAGIYLSASDLTAERLRDALRECVRLAGDYILIETIGLAAKDELIEIISACSSEIGAAECDIYIENGYRKCESGAYVCTPFSHAAELVRISDEMAERTGKNCFGVCLNIGYANLTGKNIRVMLEELGASLKLLHAGDNGGRIDEHQMPYTFTAGRGIQSTDWYHVIGQMALNRFQGKIVFDVAGLIERTPAKLQRTMLKLLCAIGREWEEQVAMPEYLGQSGKKLILFGAGRMFINYMENWGQLYPPDFVVDNNPDIWGTDVAGIPVKSPQAILDIAENARNVLLCNMRYEEIGDQLDEMGIAYRCYWDHYYM